MRKFILSKSLLPYWNILLNFLCAIVGLLVMAQRLVRASGGTCMGTLTCFKVLVYVDEIGLSR